MNIRGAQLSFQFRCHISAVLGRVRTPLGVVLVVDSLPVHLQAGTAVLLHQRFFLRREMGGGTSKPKKVSADRVAGSADVLDILESNRPDDDAAASIAALRKIDANFKMNLMYHDEEGWGLLHVASSSRCVQSLGLLASTISELLICTQGGWRKSSVCRRAGGAQMRCQCRRVRNQSLRAYAQQCFFRL